MQDEVAENPSLDKTIFCNYIVTRQRISLHIDLYPFNQIHAAKLAVLLLDESFASNFKEPRIYPLILKY